MRTFSWSTCCALTSIISLAACDVPMREATDPSDSSFAGGIEVVTARVLGTPLIDLTADERARFETGRNEFEEVETIEEGLGPVFNEAACSTCHTNPVGGTNGRVRRSAWDCFASSCR